MTQLADSFSQYTPRLRTRWERSNTQKRDLFVVVANNRTVVRVRMVCMECAFPWETLHHWCGMLLRVFRWCDWDVRAFRFKLALKEVDHCGTRSAYFTQFAHAEYSINIFIETTTCCCVLYMPAVLCLLAAIYFTPLRNSIDTNIYTYIFFVCVRNVIDLTPWAKPGRTSVLVGLVGRTDGTDGRQSY